MDSIAQREARTESERVARRHLEGVDRIPFLPFATFVAVVPGIEGAEPPYVCIAWTPNVIERPYPGCAIWRAVLERYLAMPVGDDAASRAVREIVASSLRRYPTLEAWIHWADFERSRPAQPERREDSQILWPSLAWPW